MKPQTRNSDLSHPQGEKDEGSPELMFDDEPLERILYGKNLKGPTRANLFVPALDYVQKIGSAYLDGNLPDVLETASELVTKKYRLSKQMCFELAAVFKRIVPNRPHPIIKLDLSALGSLLEHVWNLALKTDDKSLQEMIGTPLYRWYEHHKHYPEARRVLTGLTEICRQEMDHVGEAGMMNNFAFEYLLEGQWKEARPYFERAAEIFKENDDPYEYANARANYWTCVFECDELENVEEIETELKAFTKILDKPTGWHKRKPLILLAKIEERRGNKAAAIRRVEQAITASEKSNTLYPELDKDYLDNLKRKLLP